MLTSRKSRFFSWFKIRSKHDSNASRTSSEEFYSLPTTPISPTSPTSPISPISPITPTNLSRLVNPISPSDVAGEDQRDGFYQYGNSFEEDPLSLLLPPYQVPEDNKHEERDPEYFSMTPPTLPTRLSRPYTVSSEDWVVLTPPRSPSSSPPSLVFPGDDLTDEERVAHFNAVLKIFTKLFTMAKMLHVTFLAYGVHLDHSQTGLLFWIKRAEAEIQTNSLGTLIEIVENLFYVLYARLVLEMANAELCYLYETEKRPLSTWRQFVLPPPDHLYQMFLVFKDILDSPSMCEQVPTNHVTYYQQGYVDRIIGHSNVIDDVPDEILRFRRHMAKVASDKNSEYHTKWDKLIPLFHNIPAKVLVTLAEKYLTLYPKFVLDDDIPLSELPFRGARAVDRQEREDEIVFDYRVATLALLKGTCIGDERRDYGNLLPFPLAKQKKCICTVTCSCAAACTREVRRPCPCAERHLRILLARRRADTGTSDFMTRANTLGRAYFQGFAVMNTDVELTDVLRQIQLAFDGFQLEIEKERANVPAPVWM